jgi:hypothetical protein
MKWHFDRPSRLDALIARALRAHAYLLRSACDVPARSPAWDRYQSRAAVVRRRLAALQRCARLARREARRATAAH